MGSQCLGQKNEIKREKFLIFSLGDDRFGIPLHTVKEIIGSVEITPIPQVPNFFKGLINLRGDIISVIDLRTKLSIAPSSKLALKKTSIIIVEIEGIKIGTVVDDVDEVVGLEQNQIERSLEIQGNVSSKFVTGVAKQEKQNLVLLLDIGKVLSIDELKMLKGNTNK
ncbi:MAG: hypothetical protein A2504_16055 [Bdellovibrionales bacterium RIFOXYD12_FULL_39_22]|nr:MAG: hypothetical protein A2385_07965 [Bdellovibrionales bacterium RIFOXYB1_FULL_39_21]OFZ43063.1 MAG: hypothetical protein A2485_11260 [Bdellovibrionales bacterium RIFOXYC12_FULL_39_17]OFZ50981.1 MAG: hypothetical protein A2404_06880 [Bdellovibrionales bacterium RIFOXYC1_FULL_39_130]OFZ73645.1 MAG: hypothetical protein A2451_06415 [Bdellovibrionales bacterium RIFOXYC2_FULL_39_8]OFZ78204.1 MAG: hypothetical protein A2560_02050 [Bdellovibrionales bacterium RIFOXYD1_FULL_39_84]OFZ94051.1 MAG: